MAGSFECMYHLEILLQHNPAMNHGKIEEQNCTLDSFIVCPKVLGLLQGDHVRDVRSPELELTAGFLVVHRNSNVHDTQDPGRGPGASREITVATRRLA